jgi:two-component system nitrate/nitrite response regulator NarL
MQEAKAPQIRIVLLDDQAMVRAGLRMLIESQQGFTVVGEAADRDEALTVIEREQPDIILLELSLQGQSSLEFFTELTSAAKAARVLVVTAVDDPEMHRRALLLGSAGVLLKTQDGGTLLKAIERVGQGEVWFDQSMIAGLLSAAASIAGGQDDVRIAMLTKREREIILLVSEGLRNKQVADRLFISETTVRHHLTSIFSKLGVSNRLDLVVYAYRHGIAKPPVA